MENAAVDLGANAIVGVSLDREALGRGNMLMVSVTGTAVAPESAYDGKRMKNGWKNSPAPWRHKQRSRRTK